MVPAGGAVDPAGASRCSTASTPSTATARSHGATVFPHNIGLGAADDPSWSSRIGAGHRRRGRRHGHRLELRAGRRRARTTIRWGRTYEGYSEDPEIVAALGAAVHRRAAAHGRRPAVQRPTDVLATAKHFIGDGGPVGHVDVGGFIIDQGDTASTRRAAQAHLPPYQAAIEAGVGSIMASFSSWNGTKMHAQPLPPHRCAEGRARLQRLRRRPTGPASTRSPATTPATSSTASTPASTWSWCRPTSRTFIDAAHGRRRGGRRADGAHRRRRPPDPAGEVRGRASSNAPSRTPRCSDRRLVSRTAHLARRGGPASLVLAQERRPGAADRPPTRQRSSSPARRADDIGLQSGGWTITEQGTAGADHPGHDHPRRHPARRRRRPRSCATTPTGAFADAARGRRSAPTWRSSCWPSSPTPKAPATAPTSSCRPTISPSSTGYARWPSGSWSCCCPAVRSSSPSSCRAGRLRRSLAARQRGRRGRRRARSATHPSPVPPGDLAALDVPAALRAWRSGGAPGARAPSSRSDSGWRRATPRPASSPARRHEPAAAVCDDGRAMRAAGRRA